VNAPFPALFCDGETLRSRAVELSVTDDGQLRIVGEDLDRIVAVNTLRVSGRLGRLPRFMRLADGRVIEAPCSNILDAVLDAMRPPAPLAHAIHWLESKAAIAAVATLLLIAATAVTFWQGVPRMAKHIALAVPPAIEIQAGRAGYAVFARAFQPTTLTYNDQHHVQRALGQLEHARKLHVEPAVAFLSMNTPNAFALPGGIIVVTDELVKLAKTDDELAAVLAHEIGHIEKRHGLQSILRNSSALLVVSTITGDLSTLTTFSGTLPFVLLQRGYAREFEQEADDYAVGLLRDAKIDPVNLATILERLEAARPVKGPDFSYLSTHPSTADRIRALRGPRR
jgi:Zn-dependent protease with chaperone function